MKLVVSFTFRPLYSWRNISSIQWLGGCMDASDLIVEVRRKITALTGNGNLAILLVAIYFTDCALGLIKVVYQ
jgi:hypothetical protein